MTALWLGWTGNKGPLRNNTRIILIKEATINLEQDTLGTTTESYTRITSSASHRNEKTDTTTTVEQKGRGVGEDDNLYFVPSDEDTEYIEKEEENGRNDNEISDMIDENTVRREANTRTGKINTDRFTEIDMIRKTFARKKKMTIK
jgi:hypothetical protein